MKILVKPVNVSTSASTSKPGLTGPKLALLKEQRAFNKKYFGAHADAISAKFNLKKAKDGASCTVSFIPSTDNVSQSATIKVVLKIDRTTYLIEGGCTLGTAPKLADFKYTDCTISKKGTDFSRKFSLYCKKVLGKPAVTVADFVKVLKQVIKDSAEGKPIEAPKRVSGPIGTDAAGRKPFTKSELSVFNLFNVSPIVGNGIMDSKASAKVKMDIEAVSATLMQAKWKKGPSSTTKMMFTLESKPDLKVTVTSVIKPSTEGLVKETDIVLKKTSTTVKPPLPKMDDSSLKPASATKLKRLISGKQSEMAALQKEIDGFTRELNKLEPPKPRVKTK